MGVLVRAACGVLAARVVFRNSAWKRCRGTPFNVHPPADVDHADPLTGPVASEAVALAVQQSERA